MFISACTLWRPVPSAGHTLGREINVTPVLMWLRILQRACMASSVPLGPCIVGCSESLTLLLRIIWIIWNTTPHLLTWMAYGSHCLLPLEYQESVILRYPFLPCISLFIWFMCDSLGMQSCDILCAQRDVQIPQPVIQLYASSRDMMPSSLFVSFFY